MPTTQSQDTFLHYIFAPRYPLLPPHPYFSGDCRTVVCVYEFYLFAFLVCSFVAFSLYPTHERGHMVLDFFSLTYFAEHDVLRSIHAVTSGSIEPSHV